MNTDAICFVDGYPHLLPDLRLKNIIAGGYKTAGIYQVKYFPVPVGHAVLAVAGNAAYIIHNGFTLFQ
jgi:hypothetical protein